jgi:hypothetical protein
MNDRDLAGRASLVKSRGERGEESGSLRWRLLRWMASVWAACVVAIIAGADVSAELPDEVYRQLLSEAPELLHLRIDDVEEVHSDGDTISYKVTATVDKVERTGRGYKRGDQLIFDSYYVLPGARQRGFVGPKSPPKLYKGWAGWVFLSEEFGNRLSPAAYGRSFRHSFDRGPVDTK